MIVKGIILIILIFGALVFLAVKMSESIVKAELKMFFFGLFFVTILTLFNIILSIYFVIKAKDKTGPRGRKGHKGKIGDPGNDGECKESCRKNSVHQMIINKLETSRDGTKNNFTENQNGFRYSIPIFQDEKGLRNYELIVSFPEKDQYVLR